VAVTAEAVRLGGSDQAVALGAFVTLLVLVMYLAHRHRRLASTSA